MARSRVYGSSSSTRTTLAFPIFDVSESSIADQSYSPSPLKLHVDHQTTLTECKAPTCMLAIPCCRKERQRLRTLGSCRLRGPRSQSFCRENLSLVTRSLSAQQPLLDTERCGDSANEMGSECVNEKKVEDCRYMNDDRCAI